LPRSTVHRIVTALIAEGLGRHRPHPPGGVRIGPGKLARLASASQAEALEKMPSRTLQRIFTEIGENRRLLGPGRGPCPADPRHSPRIITSG